MTLNRQGINDQRFFSAAHFFQQYPQLRKARYQALMKSINPGVRRYNIFWSTFEGSGVGPSNSSSLKCPSGYTLVSLPPLGRLKCLLVSFGADI